MKKVLVIAIAAAILAGFAVAPIGADEKPTESRQLFSDGARLWPVYCAQCHNARPGSEFAPYQWETILMHMRTQANLPARDARAIVEGALAECTMTGLQLEVKGQAPAGQRRSGFEFTTPRRQNQRTSPAECPIGVSPVRALAGRAEEFRLVL
jgi:hypothetical protein